MSGAHPRRTARSTRVVNQNAEQQNRRAALATSSKDKLVTGKAASNPTKPSSNTTAAPTAATTAPDRKRKALGDNTNAEKKKKSADKTLGKIRPKDHADTPGKAASTSTMRMVVELPMRTRPKSSKTQNKLETAKAFTAKPHKPAVVVDISMSPDPPNGVVDVSPERITRSKVSKSAVKSSPKLGSAKTSLAKSPRARGPRSKLLPAEDEGPPTKRRRSNHDAPAAAGKPHTIQPSNVVPLQEADNPFEIGLKTTSADVASAVTAQPWDDLDAEDENDPLMVAEYVNEIFDYMKELEIRNMPSSTYMNAQHELDWNMRGILMDWLIQVHARFKMLPETLFLATNIIDRFLSLRIVSLIKLQLVGITALFIASKYEEIMAPSVTHFLQVSDSEYTEKEILQAEKYVLRTLGWELSYPNPMSWLRRASKADSYDLQTRTLAKFFIEISVVEHRLIKFTPSMLAAAALWLARLMMEKDEWDANLEHYSGYTERKLIPCANVMLNYIIQPKPLHESIWKKYSGKKYSKCAVYARKWAEQRWPPDSSDEAEEEAAEVEVDLVTALPVLREQIKSKAGAVEETTP